MSESELWLDLNDSSDTRAVGVHPTAIVHPRAEFGQRVSIGAFSCIGPKVICDDDVVIGNHVNIGGRTFIGKKTKIHHYCSIGTRPQDLKYQGEDTKLVIGSSNSIREYVNISIGTAGGSGVTQIGDNNLFMVFVHIAHDCVIGNGCIFANSVNLAGHVVIDDHVVLGGMSGVHQFCRFGAYSMMTGGSSISKNVPPFCRVHGHRAKPCGLNTIGLKRAGMPAATLATIKKMYRLLYQDNQTLTDALENIRNQIADCDVRTTFLDFFRAAGRPICR